VTLETGNVTDTKSIPHEEVFGRNCQVFPPEKEKTSGKKTEKNVRPDEK
jgi:hypothetical protein